MCGILVRACRAPIRVSTTPPNPANYVGRGGGSSVSLATACRARRGAFASDGTMDQKGKAASRGRGGWNFSRMAPGVTTCHLFPSLYELRGLNHDHDDVSPEQGGEDDAESCTFLVFLTTKGLHYDRGGSP